MARQTKAQSEAEARETAPAAGGEDPGLRDLLAQKDRVYAENARQQAARDKSEAEQREARASTSAPDIAPAGNAGAGDDPGLANLLASRDATYRDNAEAQRTMNEAASRQAGIGSIYRTYQVPPDSTPAPKGPAAPTVTAEAIETPRTKSARRKARGA